MCVNLLVYCMLHERRYRYHITYRSRGPRGMVIYLGEKYPGIYLTARESQCARFLLRGYTSKGIGQALALSTRTVDFYINRMKVKLNCRRRDQLINHLIRSDFI